MYSQVAGRWRLISLSTLLVAVVANGAWFQATAPSPDQVPAPTIRVSTHLVLVDVVVTDKQGKPITGLHPEDFEVEENGKAQKVTNRSMKVDQTFDANTYQQIVQHGLLLHMDLDPQPGNNQLRLGVQDNRTGLVGSLGAPMPQ